MSYENPILLRIAARLREASEEDKRLHCKNEPCNAMVRL